MEANNIMYLGEVRRMNIHIEPLEGVNMDSIKELLIEVYCSPKKAIKYSVTKSDGNYIPNNHEIVLDTNAIGTGRVIIQVTARIEVEGKNGESAILVDIDRLDTRFNIIR